MGSALRLRSSQAYEILQAVAETADEESCDFTAVRCTLVRCPKLGMGLTFTPVGGDHVGEDGEGECACTAVLLSSPWPYGNDPMV